MEEIKAFDDKIEVLQHMVTVHSRINKDITSDYIYANLNEPDKEFVIEMYGNARFAKMCALKMGESIRVKVKNKELKLNEEETNKIIQRIILTSNQVFDAYMDKIAMLVNLNRNKKENYMAQRVSPTADEELTEDPIKVLEDKLKGVKR